MSATESADLLIEARLLVPVEPANVVLENAGVAVRDGRIVGLGAVAAVRTRFEAREHVKREKHVLLPGFVNAHTHAAGVLMRGVPVFPPRMRWLRETIAPIQERLMGPDFVRDGTRLGIAEMLRAGITAFADQSLFPDESARAAASARVRAVVGLPFAEVATGWAESVAAHLEKAGQLWDEYKSSPWVSLQFAPDPPYALGDASLTRLRRLADELDARVAMSLHETEVELRDSLAHHGKKPLRRLADLGLLRPGFAALQMNRLDEEDLDLSARTGISVVAAPQSNLRLGSGGCPIPALLEREVAVGLGSGSPASAGALDMLGEARAAGLFSGSLSSAEMIRLATLGGATALGLGALTGSIETGKAADLVCIEIESPASRPRAAVFDSILFEGTRKNVTDVWIGGRAAVTDGRLLAFNEEELADLASTWAARVHSGGAA
jgi:5-methylthioadenosine/S-adenosylhomocysteine deaminase